MPKDEPQKMITISDFLTQEEISKCAEIYRRRPGSTATRAIREEVIMPNLDRINAALGQQNGATYLAYLCEFTMDHAERGRSGPAEFPVRSVEPQVSESD